MQSNELYHNTTTAMEIDWSIQENMRLNGPKSGESVGKIKQKAAHLIN